MKVKDLILLLDMQNQELPIRVFSTELSDFANIKEIEYHEFQNSPETGFIGIILDE